MSPSYSRVLVTGASRGLGRELATSLGRPGVEMAIVARTATGLSETARRVRATGASALEIPADLADPADCERIFDRCVASIGGLDILIHNAAVWEGARFDTADPNDFPHVVGVNLIGPMLLTHRFAKGMIEQRRGHIIFIGSTAGVLCAGYSTAYTASKFGLWGFARTIRTQLRSYGIKVTTIFPGSIASDMSDDDAESVYSRHGGTRMPTGDMIKVLHCVLNTSDMCLLEEIYMPAMMDRFGD